MSKFLLKVVVFAIFFFTVFSLLALLKPKSVYSLALPDAPCRYCVGSTCQHDTLYCSHTLDECIGSTGCGSLYCVNTCNNCAAEGETCATTPCCSGLSCWAGDYCYNPNPPSLPGCYSCIGNWCTRVLTSSCDASKDCMASQPCTTTGTGDAVCTGSDCYDPDPNRGTSCIEDIKGCGTLGCPSTKKPYLGYKGSISTANYCGMRCVDDPQCSGFCSSGSWATCEFREDPVHGCGGYCDACSRQIGIYWCLYNGQWSNCGEQCKYDSWCANVAGGNCGGGPTGTSTATSTPPPGKSCTVSLLPTTAIASVGSLIDFTASVTVNEGSISEVIFSSDNSAVATIDPTVDSTPTYSTGATAVSIGTATITADVMMGADTVCSDTSTIDVTTSGPWWQVQDSDVSTNGDLSSQIPATCTLPGCNPVFNLKGTGTFPGVSLAGGTADFAAGSSRGKAAEDPNNWLVNTSYQGKTYDYAYFARQIPSDVPFTEITDTTVNGGLFESGGTQSRGYIWYHYNGNTLGDLTISGNVNLNGSRKVVLLVEGADLYLTGRINIQQTGSGFFMVVVGKNANGLKGNIWVDASLSNPTQPELEGLFLAEGSFLTGAGTDQLHVLGSVVAYDGIMLERDLGQPANETEPSELFEYSPELMSVFPQVFTTRRMRWKEVAP